MSQALFSPRMVAFTTQEYAHTQNLSVPSASRQLGQRQKAGTFTRLTRGVWANPAHPYFTIYACVPKLLGDEQGYISFLTALHLHGVISQIPNTVQVATTGHSRFLATPVGQFEFFQLKPQLFQHGIEQSDSFAPYFIATVEKALFDTLYIATRKSKRFSHLPELDIEGGNFDVNAFKKIVNESECAQKIRKAVIDASTRLGLL